MPTRKLIEKTPGLPINPGSGPHQVFLAALVTQLQSLLVRIIDRTNGVYPGIYTDTPDTKPVAADFEGTIIYVSDGGAGAKFRGSDGSAWVNLG